jgi:transposase
MNRLRTLQLAVTRRQSKARLAQLNRQIAALGDEIDTRLHQCPRRARAYEILVSIPGLGAVSAKAIVIECPEIGRLGTKQIAALSGLAPMIRQSGRWQDRATIQGGRAVLRQALYMPALVASRHNPDHARKYQDMIGAGKAPKLALTAIMRKL